MILSRQDLVVIAIALQDLELNPRRTRWMRERAARLQTEALAEHDAILAAIPQEDE